MQWNFSWGISSEAKQNNESSTFSNYSMFKESIPKSIKKWPDGFNVQMDCTIGFDRNKESSNYKKFAPYTGSVTLTFNSSGLAAMSTPLSGCVNMLEGPGSNVEPLSGLNRGWPSITTYTCFEGSTDSNLYRSGLDHIGQKTALLGIAHWNTAQRNTRRTLGEMELSRALMSQRFRST